MNKILMIIAFSMFGLTQASAVSLTVDESAKSMPRGWVSSAAAKAIDLTAVKTRGGTLYIDKSVKASQILGRIGR